MAKKTFHRITLKTLVRIIVEQSLNCCFDSETGVTVKVMELFGVTVKVMELFVVSCGKPCCCSIWKRAA